MLGDDHRETLSSINNMGMLLLSMGKLTEAAPYLRGALAGYRRTLGDDSPETLISIHNVGRVLRDLGQLDEAEAFGADAVRGATGKFPKSHLFRFAALPQHGRTLTAMLRLTEAVAELREAYEGFVQTLGPAHQRKIETIGFLIDLYNAWHTAEPGKGYDAKAAEWRAKLQVEEPSSPQDGPDAGAD